VLSDHVAVMNNGRFEQLGTPQSLYYEPQTPFVAGFVGANNRLAGRVMQVSGDLVELTTVQGLTLFARNKDRVAVGDAVAAFVRPEVADLARDMAALPAHQPRYQGTVASLLFDGANSAVLVREQVFHRIPHRPAPDRPVRRPGRGRVGGVRLRPRTCPVFCRTAPCRLTLHHGGCSSCCWPACSWRRRCCGCSA
jgi:ABC-type Fe3+/spermidine/putrescine transport system ATPase subunit